MSFIDRVEIHVFTFSLPNLGFGQGRGSGVGNVVYEQGATITPTRFAVRVYSNDGAVGSYVTHWVGTRAALGQAEMLAPMLIGRDPAHREALHDDMKRELRAYDHMGQGTIDLALWDLAGRQHGMSVAAMLGAFRERLPTYASTYHGQSTPGGLDTPEAFADYAAACQERGFHGFKIHGWNDGDVARESDNLRQVRARVGDGMPIMLDAACELRTWMDALAVGRVCDEVGCFWYEDPSRDSGVSTTGHRRLRERLKTPILVSEHIRSVEEKAEFLLGGGCDMIHVDPEYDLGITGAMKIVHVAEAFGLDIQVHACGPAHRAVAATARNTHFYEMALIGPDMPNCVPPVYDAGYSDQQEDLPADGCVPVPSGPGLGVEYDWDFIERNRTDLLVWP
ncbi:MAG: hypothetical protein OXC11_05005 [Rhodospirillales bacterium]|nr:hypothetical protein [Rhodospirillales bacterium]